MGRVATIEAENVLGQLVASINLRQCSYCKLASFSQALVKLLKSWCMQPYNLFMEALGAGNSDKRPRDILPRLMVLQGCNVA